jgi:tripeptidyl-peptidase II
MFSKLHDTAFRMPLYMGPVPEDSLPKDAKPGCTITGSLKLAYTSPLAGDKHAPCAFPLVFTVPPPAKKDPEDSEKDDVPEDKDPVDKMRKAQRVAQVCYTTEKRKQAWQCFRT